MHIKITIDVIYNVPNDGANFYIMYLKGAQIPRQVAETKKLSMVTSNVCWSSVKNFLFLTILAPRIMRRFLEFWETCALLIYINYKSDRGAHHTSRRPADWHTTTVRGEVGPRTVVVCQALIYTIENVHRSNHFRSQTWSREPLEYELPLLRNIWGLQHLCRCWTESTLLTSACKQSV